MSWLTRLRNLGRSDRVTDEIDREMRFHLAERSDQLESDGLTKADARREARRRFGNVTLEKERTRERDLLPWLETLFTDVRYAFRALRATPGFTLVAVLSLALGIGANTAIFSLINVALLKSLPVRDADGLVKLSLKTTTTEKGGDFCCSRPLWEHVRDRQDVFDGLFVYGSSSADVGTGTDARRVPVALVGGDLFSTLGVRPAIGRTLVAADDHAGCPAVAVLTSAFWQSDFGGQPDVVGRSLTLNGQPYQIVGVTAGPFFGIEFGYDVPIWTPQCSERIVRGVGGSSTGGGGYVIGRLKPTIPPEQVPARLATLTPTDLAALVPPNARADMREQFSRARFRVVPYANGIPALGDRFGDALTILMAIVGVVLLVACANVANLLLARASARRREVAVRLALGASRFRLIRQWLTESLLLALAGAAVSVLFAFWGSRGLVGMLSSSISIDLSPDTTVLLFTMAVGIGTGVAFGLVPAALFFRSPRFRSRGPAWRPRRAARPDRQSSTSDLLVGAGRGIAGDSTRFTLGKALVIAQMSLSLVMLTAAGLLVASWGRLLQIDPGFRSDGVLLAAVNTSPARLAPDRRKQVYQDVLERLRALPGVAIASAAWITPLGQNSRVVVDASEFASTPIVEARLNQVTDSYFRTIGTPLLAGRDFGPQDQPGAPLVAIVNEQLARRVYGASAAVGQHFRVQQSEGLSEPIEIVGVVGDTKWSGLREENQPIVYYALTQMTQPGPGLNFALRTDGTALAPGVKAALTAIDARFTMTLITLEDRVANSIRLPRTLAALAGFFGGLALLLAIVGLYGVMSYTVGRRRHEIAVRLALGAARGRVMGMVLGETSRLVAIGVVIGVVLALAATRLVSSFLYGVTPTDPVTFALSAVILVAVAAGAAMIPARRAACMNPVAALREE